MRDRDSELRARVISVLNDGKVGILSTISSDTPFGYPLGSVVSYLVNNENEIIIMVSNLAEYTRNFAISEKVCMTILKQDGNDNTAILYGINYFGKVKKLETNQIESITIAYIQHFPMSKHLIEKTENNFYKISLNKIKYFDLEGTQTLDFEQLL